MVYEKVRDHNGKVVGLAINPRSFYSPSIGWKEIKSARHTEKDFSDPSRVFRKFRLRISREISVLAFETRAIGFSFGSMDTTPEFVMKTFRVEESGHRYHSPILFDLTKQPVELSSFPYKRFIPSERVLWAMLDRHYPLRLKKGEKIPVK